VDASNCRKGHSGSSDGDRQSVDAGSGARSQSVQGPKPPAALSSNNSPSRLLATRSDHDEARKDAEDLHMAIGSPACVRAGRLPARPSVSSSRARRGALVIAKGVADAEHLTGRKSGGAVDFLASRCGSVR
jgi:hypothetical protein